MANSVYSTGKSKELFKRAIRVLPTGIPGHMGPTQSMFIPTDAYPFYADRAKDSHFWDIDGNEYIDLMCAYGPNVLGYNHPAVEEAANRQRQKGNCMPLPAAVQVELAETLCGTLANADWAFFLKNGGDATTFAVMCARAATGREKVIRIEGGYHGVVQWTQSKGQPGVTNADVEHNLTVPWNDVAAVQAAVDAHPGNIAAFIATPYDHPIFRDNVLPAPGYWQAIRKLCTDNGIVLIVDDVRCGFRLSLKGSADYFGFRADLACYCKAIANGHNISAVVGADALRNAASNVFFTGSYWSSAVPMAAGVACLNELRRLDGARLMIQKGERLTDGLKQAAKEHGIDFRVSGVPSMPFMRIANDRNFMMHQQFTAEMTRRGVFMVCHHNHFMNCSLTDDDIQRVLAVADEAFGVVAKKNPEKLIK